MKNSTKQQQHIKNIQSYCEDLSKTFSKLSLEFEELSKVNSEADSIEAIPSAVISRVENNVHAASDILKRTERSNSRPTKERRIKPINLFGQPTSRFQEGDTVRIKNHYKGKFGDLFGKEGVVTNVGKSFIFLEIPGIPVIQQRSEGNLELVSRR